MTDFSSASTPPVVMRYGAFGDMVMLVPMLRWLAKHCGGPVDVISSGGWTRPLLGGQSCVGELCLVDSRNTPYWLNRSQQNMVRWLAANPDRPLIICQTDDKARHFARRAGLGDDRVYWAADDDFLAGEHWVERWLRIAHKCYRQDFDDFDLSAWLHDGWLDLAPSAQQDCQRWLQEKGWQDDQLILIQAGNKRTMRRGAVDRSSNRKFWPDEKWQQLGQELLDAEPRNRVVFCGSPEEADYNQLLADRLASPRASSVASELPIPRLLALLARATGMISVDTGPAHAAAAVGCPLVVLFGDMDPSRWRPYPARAGVEIVRAATQLSDIPVGDVLSAWRNFSNG